METYRDYNTYLKETFGERVQKIAIDAGLSCPNRDGTISDKGCIFCDGRGSGTGEWVDRGLCIREQVMKAREYFRDRYKAKKFIAYFQSFTNTYAPPSALKAFYDEALDFKDVVGLSVATRPDCLDAEILGLLASYQKDHLVWLELGLQSSHDATLTRINRGHDAACFEKGVILAREFRLNVCAHVILGLPGEDKSMMLQTARFISRLPLQGLKIHLLYVSEGTPLAELYRKGEIQCLDQDEYVELVVDFLELTRPDIIIQRLTGDPVRSELIAPEWALEKLKNLNLIRKRLVERNTRQRKSLGD